MRHVFSDSERRLTCPILPCTSRGFPPVDDRRVLNGTSWVLRLGAGWRDLPERYGPCTT